MSKPETNEVKDYLHHDMRVQSLSFPNRRIKTNNDEGMRLIRLQIDRANRHGKWWVY